METSYVNMYAMSDAAILVSLGSFIKDQRLQQNKTQQQVAEAAGINRSTVVLMEKGQGGTLSSFIQVLRALELLHLLHFEIPNTPSPLLLAKEEQQKRQRARNKNKGNNYESSW